ncbi:hypothetical protein BCV70DRAFT_200193 [Testicularia cyperi]|uniref:Uncharacterized protein n=1 Tax=Testicularia cyperi TaxID=1882483 RepID=A0A317XNU8_9BASI|nr:hypothetical protein BCV70DRAFT_200193 [Testicularia cyperi]
MLEQNVDQNSLGPGEQTSGGGTAERNGSGEASLRATYAFSGDDGQGVDLTKGRVRMTINLPLVSSDASVARRMNSAQLMSDFESPYVRIRHKLKVKLGFGLHTDVATSEGAAWGQALVMCVPVRFTEAPPKEVQDHFAPESRSAGRNRSRSDLTSADRRNVGSHGLDDGSVAETERGNNGRSEGSVDNASSGASAAIAEDAIVPLLPAYAQLFREDGSRLADEGEDLPRYPGRMSVIGEIDVDPANITSNGVIAQLPRVDEDVGDDSTAASGSDATVPPYGGGDTTLASASAQNKIVGGAEVAATSAALAGTPPPPMPSSLASTRSPSTYNFSSLPQGIRASPSAPMPMDRSTSLPGHRVLFRTASSGTVGLRTSPSYSVLQGGGSYTMDQTVASAGLGSSAFDPLPARPAMRRRSATTTSLVSASRVLPSEVLDESLVTDAMEDEEDRMDRLRADQVEDVYEDRDVLDLNDEEEEDDVDEEQAVRRDDVDAEEDDGELGDGPEVDEDSEGNMPSDQQRSSRESQTSQVGRGRSMGFAMNLQLAEDQHAGTLAGEGDDEADDAEYIGDVHPAEAEAIVQVGQAW